MKKFFGFLLVAVIIVLAFVLLWKDWILKTTIETGVTTVTGFDTKVGNLKFNLPSTLHIQDLEIKNPSGKGFEKDIFASLPEIFVDLSLDELLKKEAIHLREVRLNVGEVNIEKTKDGVSNVSLLTSVAQHNNQGSEQTQPAQTASNEKPLPFQLDRLALTINRVSYHDPSTPIPQNLDVDLKIENQIFNNITDPKALVSLILMKIMQSTTFGNLLGLGQDFFNTTLGGAVGQGQALLDQTTGALQNQANALVDSTKDLAGDKAADLLKGTVGSLDSATGATTEKLSGLFGKVKSGLGAVGDQAQEAADSASEAASAPAAAPAQ